MNPAIITTIIIAVLGIGVLLFVARRVMRIAIKLILVGAVILIVLIGAVLMWWNGGSNASQPKETRPAATRRANNR